jgi:hypothetical protein
MPKVLTPKLTENLANAMEGGLAFDGRKQGRCAGCGEEVQLDLTALPGLVVRAKEIIRMDEEGKLCGFIGLPSSPQIITSLSTGVDRGS